MASEIKERKKNVEVNCINKRNRIAVIYDSGRLEIYRGKKRATCTCLFARSHVRNANNYIFKCEHKL